MTERGRITPVDVVFFGVAVAALTFLMQPMLTLLGQANLDPSVEYMFVMIPGGLVVSLLWVIYRTSVVGGTS